MAWDIYGNKLRPGHCEVHPDVNVEYPCHFCLREKDQQQQHADPLEDRLQQIEQRLNLIESAIAKAKGGA